MEQIGIVVLFVSCQHVWDCVSHVGQDSRTEYVQNFKLRWSGKSRKTVHRTSLKASFSYRTLK